MLVGTAVCCFLIEACPHTSRPSAEIVLSRRFGEVARTRPRSSSSWLLVAASQQEKVEEGEAGEEEEAEVVVEEAEEVKVEVLEE